VVLLRAIPDDTENTALLEIFDQPSGEHSAVVDAGLPSLAARQRKSTTASGSTRHSIIGRPEYEETLPRLRAAISPPSASTTQNCP